MSAIEGEDGSVVGWITIGDKLDWWGILGKVFHYLGESRESWKDASVVGDIESQYSF